MGCAQTKPSKKPSSSAAPPPKPIVAMPASAHPEDIKESYIIGRVINNGKFGVVREGYLKETPKQKVAIKSIDRNSSSSNPEHLRREIENLQRVNHPNVMKLYNVYMDDQYIHLVTELCTGGELFDRMLKRGRFDEVEAAKIMRQVLEAVEHLHSLMIVHRDLKPENFMFLSAEQDAPLKLIDFGFSKKLDTAKQQIQTMVGTPSYVSPELLTGSYGPESDMWSCGVILYTILAGRYPFYDEDEQKIYQMVKVGEFNLNDAAWVGVSEEAKDLVRHLLEKDISKRYTATRALQHPWFNKTEGPEIRVEQKLVEAYKLLKENSRLQRDTMLFLVQHFTMEEIRNFRGAFQDADTQNTNELTPAELKRCIQTLAPPGTVVELESIFRDISGTEGKINYLNLIEASKACKSNMYEETAWGMFKARDTDNTGLVPTRTLKTALQDLKKPMSEEEFQLRLKHFGVTRDTVDFEEFKKVLLQD